MKILRLLIGFLIIPLLGSAQQYSTRTYTIDDGLPSNQVNCLYLDSTGYLWVGTDAGVGIFDGTNFKIINKKDGLASNDVRAIIQDDSGSFWFACFGGGLTKFDGKNYTSYTVKNGFHSNFIRRLFYSKTYKTLFIGANDGFYTLKDGQFEFYGKANGKLAAEHEILWFLEGKGFVYVFPFKDHLIKFYPNTKVINQNSTFTLGAASDVGIPSALVKANHDTVWAGLTVSTATGIKRFTFKRSGLAFNLCEDDKGNVWVPVFGGVVSGIYRLNGNTVEDFTYKLGLEDVKLNYVLFDHRSGILWMASEKKGLIAYSRSVFTYAHHSSFLQGKHDFRKLFYFNGAKYLVYKDVITKLNHDSSQGSIPISLVEAYKPVSRIIQRYPVGSNRRNTEFYEVTSDKAGSLWLSTTMGLMKLSKDEKSITKSVIPYPKIRFGSIAFNANDDLFNWGYWIDSLSIVHQPNISPSPIIQQFTMAGSDLPKEITKMLPIGRNMLFSSLYGGLYLFDNKTFVHLNKACPRLSDNISDMCQNVKGDIVYCTNTGEIGVGALANGNFTMKHLLDSLNQAFGRNFIWLICDKSNMLYVGTNRGLLLINLLKLYAEGKKDIRYYSNSEGYSDYSLASPVLDDDGAIWLGSQDNLVRVDTKALASKHNAATNIVLTKLETTDSTFVFASGGAAPKATEASGRWVFPYGSNNITFYFNNINLLNPEKDRFSVQLEGFDESFKETGSERKAVYTNLPAGRYKFVARVHNLNTLQEKSQTLCEFTISPPYWQAWWFYILVSILLILIIIAVYYYRERRLRETAKAQLENVELEMQALQAQMNPHFMFNIFNSLQRYILERDVKKGVQLLGEITNMIRQTFTLASKKQITLREEVAYLDSYLKLEKGRYADKFQYEIITADSLSLSDTLIPSMLIQPMVENAVKHGLSPLEGADGHLKIVFSALDGQSVKCTIEDNGIGLEKSLAAKRDNATRLSQALSITQRRIELFRRTSKNAGYSVTLIDRSKGNPDQTGTVVTIILPNHSN